MKRLRVITLYVVISIVLIEVNAYADLKTLMEMGRNQDAIAKTLKRETRNYNRIKEAIISGKLEEGMLAEKIQRRYGEPIIDIYDKKKNAYKWLYMPATSTHFEGEKLYLFVDEEDRLVGWSLVEE